MFQLRYGGMILGTQIATSASGGKIDFKGIFLPGLCFFSWRIGHFNLLANGKFLYFLFYLGYIMLRSNQGSSRPALQWGASVPWCGTGDCRAEPPSQSQCLSIIHLLWLNGSNLCTALEAQLVAFINVVNHGQHFLIIPCAAYGFIHPSLLTVAVQMVWLVFMFK